MVRRPHVIGLVISIVCLAGLVGVTGGVSDTQAIASQQPVVVEADTVSNSTPEGFSRTTYSMTVYENGSVRWATIHSRPLNESEISAFETYATEFNTTETGLYRGFVTQGESLAATGTRLTNRTMNATNFRKRAYVDEDGLSLRAQGKVEMSFLWTNLSTVDDTRVTLGEAFDTGLYVGPNQRLLIRAGPQLNFENVYPDPDSQDDPDSLAGSDWIAWEGEHEFNPERPLVRFQPAATTITTTQTTVSTPATTTPTTDVASTPPRQSPTTQPAETDGGDGLGGLLVVGLIVLLLVGGTVTLYRTVLSADEDQGGTHAESMSTGHDSGSASETPSQSTSSSQSKTTVTDEDLLSDTDRVQSLLESHGGRMRQSAIVEETDWSKSKVSMLLSDMEDDDEISKLRVGRENIISLPGHEPDAAGSPFEDEE